MKEIILAFATLFISAAPLFNGVKAQPANSNLGNAVERYMEVSFSFGVPTSINSSSGNLNTVNIKAVRDFTRNFKSVTDEKWYKVSNGYLARCMFNGIENMAAYDLKGNWKFTIRYYDEKILPEEVRAIVKGDYYDYSITCVEEIHIDGKTIYQVHMQDNHTWKNVRICDDVLEVEEDFNKK